MTELFYLEFILTKNCNQKCPYCDLTNKNITTTSEADIDYIKWLLDTIPTDNLYIEITGGEVGLISNLHDLATTIKLHKNVKFARIMSNGLVRINHPSTIDIVDRYNEHLVEYINGTEFIKFYNMDFDYQDNIKYVIVLDERTVRSILENYEYFEEYGLFNKNKFWLKQYVPRNGKFTPEHKADLLALYSKINTTQSKYCTTQLMVDNNNAREVCKKVSFLPGIDIIDRKLLHCSYHNFTDRITYDCTKTTLTKLVNKTLFKDEAGAYCDQCYLYFRDADFLAANNNSNYRE